MAIKNFPAEFSASPKYELLAQHLREQILSGILAPGDRLPSYPEMRARGVSQPTMDRALALLERERLIVREARRGVFVADRQAKVEITTKLIGFVQSGAQQRAQHPYWAYLLEGVQATAHRHDFHVLIVGGQAPDTGWEKVDGVVVSERDWAAALRRLPQGIPCVSLLWEIEGVPSVVSDTPGGVEQAMEHLLSLGHRRIAALAQPIYNARDEELFGPRQRRYEEALVQAGIERDPRWARPIWPERFDPILNYAGHARETMSRWLEEDWNGLGCTALLAHNDEVAIGAIAALRDAGVRVPEDVSVVGFDGTEVADYARPRLTTVEVPLREIGAAGVDLLLKRMQGASGLPTKIVLPTQLRVGESTGPV